MLLWRASLKMSAVRHRFWHWLTMASTLAALGTSRRVLICCLYLHLNPVIYPMY